MRVKIKNWRCIKEVEFDLSRINIFLGQNATGKSSLAYALYFLSKASRLGVKETLEKLYGLNFKNLIIRADNNQLCYSTEITIDNSFVKIKDDDKFESVFDDIWAYEYLLPAGRLAHFRGVRNLLRSLDNIFTKKIDDFSKGMFVLFLFRMFEELPLFPPVELFLLDLATAVTRIKVVQRESSSDLIKYIVLSEKILLPLLSLKIVDPYTDLKLPFENAPDGQADSVLIDYILKNALENSLIVIEEPEIYKNPIFQFEMMEKISELALDKKLTIIMSTHSEIIPLAIAKLVEEGKLKPDVVRIYYLTRSKEEPWTKVKKIEVYEDGTLEELPDSKQITAQLF
jgi:predicted ATPase